MEFNDKVQQEIAHRLTASEQEREQTRQFLNQGELLKADTAKRIEKRKWHLLANQSLTPILGKNNWEVLAKGPVHTAPKETQRAFEIQLGGLDTQPAWFLELGARIRRTVGRIHIRDASRRIGWGTGFLVAPNLLLTNQHVLDSLTTARFSRVEFDYEETFAGEFLPSATFNLAPEIFFMSCPADGGMDYALVAVASHTRPDSRRSADLAEFGYNILIREEAKLINGELINSVHHPEGQPRQVSLRENRLMAVLDLWLHYETDTTTGSSGAPLYNDQWQVVGIHHAAVEKRDDTGNILAIGGGRWQREMGDYQKWWYANEGLRISRFIADIEARVKAAMNSATLSTTEYIITEKGYMLLQAMLNPPQDEALQISLPIIPENNPTGQPLQPNKFNPE
jgi:endonuclease G